MLTRSASDLRAHLLHDMAAMNLDRDLAEADLAGDLLVHQPGRDQRHHLALARA